MIVTNLLFTGAMVRAIIREIEKPGTGKTETRRCIIPQPVGSILPVTSFNHGRMEIAFGPANRDKDGGPKWWQPPAQGGDLIYVREAWRTESRAYDDLSPTAMGGEETVVYEADAEWGSNKTVGRLRASMHMPRWASRITLEVVDAGWEPLQSISEASAKAEGYWENGKGYGCFETHNHRTDMTRDARSAFVQLWDSINGDRPGLAWKHNPLVWALRFRPHLINVDAYLERNAA